MSFYKEDSLMRSDQIKKGVERAPNRSLLYALGYTEEELNRPLVGVVSSWNEIVPGHIPWSPGTSLPTPPRPW